MELTKEMLEELKKSSANEDEKSGTPMDEFLGIVYETGRFLQSQKLNGKPLTDDHIIMVITVLRVLYRDEF